jgi:hypothetical protein
VALSALVASFALPSGGAFASTQGLPPVPRAQAQVHRIDRQLRKIARHHGNHLEKLSAKIMRLRAERRGLGSPLMMGHARWVVAQHSFRRGIKRLRARMKRSGRVVRGRVLRLQQRRVARRSWLSVWGTFRACPVEGPLVLADNFGVMVRLPGVPVHRHEGDDIDAAVGTPIVAPFPGYAFATASKLGGSEVTVDGASGFVYNAHLSAYGTLGYVHTGDVIGYVGTTGDATGPHDHFEWHPGGGAAVDPDPLLLLVCRTGA